MVDKKRAENELEFSIKNSAFINIYETSYGVFSSVEDIKKAFENNKKIKILIKDLYSKRQWELELDKKGVRFEERTEKLPFNDKIKKFLVLIAPKESLVPYQEKQTRKL